MCIRPIKYSRRSGYDIDEFTMTIRTVLRYPDPRLRRKGKPVVDFDDKLTRLVEDMFDTMYAEGGVGLAAIQIGVVKRLFVMDVSETRNEKQVFINPEFTPIVDEQKIEFEEGCLSVPDFRYDVGRYAQISVAYQDITGVRQQDLCSGLASVCFQHELDHLNGKLFVDYLPPKERRHFLKQLKEKQKQEHKAERLA